MSRHINLQFVCPDDNVASAFVQLLINEVGVPAAGMSMLPTEDDNVDLTIIFGVDSDAAPKVNRVVIEKLLALKQPQEDDPWTLCVLQKVVNPFFTANESALINVMIHNKRVTTVKEYWERKMIKQLQEAAEGNATFMNDFISPYLQVLAEKTKTEEKMKELKPVIH